MSSTYVCSVCGSTHTENIKIAHAKQVRHGRDFSSISEFGRSLETPGEKDTQVAPFFVCCLVGGVS